jgi:hypothetical protein
VPITFGIAARLCKAACCYVSITIIPSGKSGSLDICSLLAAAARLSTWLACRH